MNGQMAPLGKVNQARCRCFFLCCADEFSTFHNTEQHLSRTLSQIFSFGDGNFDTIFSSIAGKHSGPGSEVDWAGV